MKSVFKITLLLFLAFFVSCFNDEADPELVIDAPPSSNSEAFSSCANNVEINNIEFGCNGYIYPSPDDSPYVLPYLPGQSYPTGLTNCSSSYHASGKGDQFAFDFNMPDRSDFYAIHEGVVVKVEESKANHGDGSAGNYVIIDHQNGTFGLYYHSPPNGIDVEVGEKVKQGQRLGITGTSGYAGYPHLHLIVTEKNYDWPFNGIPISFNNVTPRHLVLQSYYNTYRACDY